MLKGLSRPLLFLSFNFEFCILSFEFIKMCQNTPQLYYGVLHLEFRISSLVFNLSNFSYLSLLL
jgi:hypothetical protein